MSKKKENSFLIHSLPNLLSMREQYAHVLYGAQQERMFALLPTLLHVAESSAAISVAYMAKDRYIDFMSNTIENGTIPEKILTGFVGFGSGALALHLLLQHTRDSKDLVRKNITIHALKESIKAIDEAIEIKKTERGEK